TTWGRSSRRPGESGPGGFGAVEYAPLPRGVAMAPGNCYTALHAARHVSEYESRCAWGCDSAILRGTIRENGNATAALLVRGNCRSHGHHRRRSPLLREARVLPRAR